ncbi:MAG: methylenetetrahydrofolate reductase [Woeseiaceae bacterium]
MKTFRDALYSEDFVVTATLPLRPSTRAKQIRTQLDELMPLLHAIQIGDNWRAEGHMDVLVLACLALQQGIDPIVHLSGRDRNRLALQSSLLGATGLGVSSLILSRGLKLPDRLRGKIKGVFDTEPAQLFELAQQVGENSDELADRGFYLGMFAPVIKPSTDWRAAQIHQRIEAGVRFIQTRPCLNIAMLRSYMQGVVRLKVPHRAAFIVELPVLTSAGMAQELENLYPGVRIPNKLARQVAAAGDPESTGIKIAADALSQMASIPGISGANILYDGDPAIVVAVVNASGIKD